MAVIPIDLTDTPIAEETTQRINFTVVDEDGVGIPAASLDSLTVTLFTTRANTIINSRDTIDILNANGGSVDANGVGYWLMDPDDNAIIGGGKSEHHTALFEWGWATTREGRQPVLLKVCNLKQVP